MRGDLTLHLRLLRRPDAVAGLVAAVAGGTALAAAYLPWYQVAARVEALGTAQRRSVAELAGWQAHPWAWSVPALAVAALLVGVSVALDRPLAPPRRSLLTVAAGLGAAVTLAGLTFPPVARFDVAGSRLRDLIALTGRLPEDVGLSFTVRPDVGLWLTLAAAVLLIGAAWSAGRGDRAGA